MKKCVIFYNENKTKAIEIYERIVKFLNSKKITVLSKENIKEADFAIVIGGDGTLLRASKEIIKKENLLTIAINAGSLGFLTEIKEEEAIKICEDYLNDEFLIDKRGILKLEINGEEFYALNEVVISNGGMGKKLISLDLNCEMGNINTYRGDGVIISTPTGSTAYSLSAGGPIISHYLDAILITPIAPHNLSNRPIVIDSKRIVEIDIKEKEIENYIIVDGDSIKKVSPTDKIIIKYSDKKLNLLLPKERNYYSILKEKLKWGENLC